MVSDFPKITQVAELGFESDLSISTAHELMGSEKGPPGQPQKRAMGGFFELLLGRGVRLVV